MPWERYQGHISKRDYEVLSLYVEDFVCESVLPSLASSHSEDLLGMDHNPFSLAEATAKLGGGISLPAVSEHLSQFIRSRLLDRTSRGFEYTPIGRETSAFVKKFRRELSAFRDSRSSPKRWEIMTRLSLASSPVSQRVLSMHADLPESSLGRHLDGMEGAGLVQRRRTKGYSLIEPTEIGRGFTDGILDEIDKILDRKIDKALAASDGTYVAGEADGGTIPVLRREGDKLSLDKASHLE